MSENGFTPPPEVQPPAPQRDPLNKGLFGGLIETVEKDIQFTERLQRAIGINGPTIVTTTGEKFLEWCKHSAKMDLDTETAASILGAPKEQLSARATDMYLSQEEAKLGRDSRLESVAVLATLTTLGVLAGRVLPPEHAANIAVGVVLGTTTVLEGCRLGMYQMILSAHKKLWKNGIFPTVRTIPKL